MGCGSSTAAARVGPHAAASGGSSDDKGKAPARTSSDPKKAVPSSSSLQEESTFQQTLEKVSKAELLPLVAHIRKVGAEPFVAEMRARHGEDAEVTHGMVREGLIAHLGPAIVGADPPTDGSGVLGLLVGMLVTKGKTNEMGPTLALWRAWCKTVAKPVRALLIIDVQNDFIDGTLSLRGCPAGQDAAETVPVINRMRETIPFDFIAVRAHPKPSSE